MRSDKIAIALLAAAAALAGCMGTMRKDPQTLEDLCSAAGEKRVEIPACRYEDGNP